MKVAMVGWEYPPFKTGGLAVHCYELTHALARKGVEVDFYMPRTDSNVVPQTDGVKIIPVGYARYGAYVTKNAYGLDFFASVHAFNNACAEELAKRGRGNDYCVVHHHDWMTAFAAMKGKYSLGLPMVSTFHSTEYDRSGMFPNAYIRDIEQKAMVNADRVITVSNYMKGQLKEKFGVDEGKIRVVYNAVRIDEFKQSWNVKHGKERIVLFLGRLAEQKAPAQFLYAAKRVLEKERHVRFVVAGTGDMMGYLINLSVSLGISPHVTFIGYLPDEQKESVYAKSDVYVMGSVSEPFGITALEAMASGTPVIVSKTSGASEVSPHRLVVDFWDVNGLAERIVALLRYRVLRDTLAHNEFEDAKGMTWDKVADQTIGVYNEIRK